MAAPAPKDQAKQVAGKAAAAALDAVVPGAGRAASLLWKHRKKIGGLSMFFLLLIPMCSGGISAPKQDIEDAAAVAELADTTGLIAAAKKAANATGPLDETGVPWTVIAGIALAATGGGRYSPWDLCDRVPDGPEATKRSGRSAQECSEEPEVQDEVTPAIGGEGDPALGPYLLKAGLLPQGDDAIEPQRIKATISSLESSPQTATDYVALRLAELRVELQKDGYSFSQESPDVAAASWAEAVRRLGVLDPNNASGCIAPFFPPITSPTAARESAAKVLDTTWRCILSQETLHTLDTSSISSDPVELTPANAVSAVIEEALTVSWAYSQWGATMPGCKTDANGAVVMDGDPETAGFFPLTQAVFTAYATDPTATRCDKAANVEAAAKAFAAGETVEPGKKLDDTGITDRTDSSGKWNKVIGGWAAMPWALGTDLPKIKSLGPLSLETARFEPSQQCVDETVAWVQDAGSKLVTVYNPDDLLPLQESDAALIAGHLVSYPLPASCVAGENAAQLLNQFVASKAGEIGRVAWEIANPEPQLDPAATTTTTLEPVEPLPFTAPQQQASAMSAVAQWFATRQATATSATPRAPIAGVNSLVQRLSVTGGALPACQTTFDATCAPEFPAPAPEGYSKRVIEIARAAGGIVEGEDVTALDLVALLSPPVFGSLSNSTCLPSAVGKAIDIALKKYAQVELLSIDRRNRLYATDEEARATRAKSVIPVDLILEQYATESSFGVGYVDESGWTGARMDPAGGVADTGVERGPYKSPSRTKGVIGPRIGETGYPDTDNGRIDGLVDEDRAVGVLQFLPSSWTGVAAFYPGGLLDANEDGFVDPHNAYDSTLLMVLYYARNAEGRDLSTDQAAREQTIAQYGGFTVGTPGFASYMQRRAAKVGPMLACLQAEGVVPPVAGVEYGPNPDGCPVSVPAGTMRDGSIDLDVHELCTKSVARAKTPHAQEAIRFMFKNLGVPYSATMRQKPGHFDCSSYVMSAYRFAKIETFQNGTAPSSYALGPAPGWSSFPWLSDVAAKDARPGDILVRIPPDGHHVMMLLDGKWIIHTGGPDGDPSHISALPKDFKTLKIRRVVPEQAQQLAP